jgi:hypothetical protein
MASQAVVLVGVQTVLAIGGLAILWVKVFPRLSGMKQPEVMVDVWGPLVLIGPLLFLCGSIGDRFDETAWTPLGGPIAAGLIGLALSTILPAGRESGEKSGRFWLAVGGWSAIGGLLLLLGAADGLTVWTGQVVFALAAVTLWCNTPALPSQGGRPTTPTERETSVWLLFAACCALAQGVVILIVGSEMRSLCSVVALGYAVLACGGALLTQDRWVSVRMTGWAAGYGALFGVGLLAIIEMFPQVAGAMKATFGESGYIEPSISVMSGMGRLAPMAGLLLALPGLVVLSRLIPAWGRAIVAAVAIVLIVVASTSWVSSLEWPEILCSDPAVVDDGTISTGD